MNAYALSKSLLMDLQPGCEKISVAGSIRRKKQEVKDIEIVAIPIVNHYEEMDLFGDIVDKKSIDVLGEFLSAKLHDNSWDWQMDMENKKWGPRYKRLRHKGNGIACDLFYAKMGSWGGAMIVRTGPSEFSHALMGLIQRRGYHVADGYFLHRHPRPAKGCRAGEKCRMIVACPTEESFFMQLGLPYIEPKDRTVERLRELENSCKPKYFAPSR